MPRLPRPPKVTQRPDEPETSNVQAETSDAPAAEVERVRAEQPAPRRRRRALMGDLIASMGSPGRAAAALKPERALENTERKAKSEKMLSGGRRPGEDKGYGLASYPWND